MLNQGKFGTKNSVSNLGTGDNRITGTGVLYSKAIKFQKSKNGDDMAMGKLIVGGEDADSRFTFNVLAMKFKKDGTPNKQYQALETIDREYKSVEMTGSVAEADMIDILGEITAEDPYKGRSGKVSVPVRYRAKFISRTDKSKDYKLGFTLQADIYVKGKRPEKRKVDGEMEDTGRLIVEGLMFDYKQQAMPINFIVDNPTGVEYFEDTVDLKTTISLTNVKLVNRIEVVERASGDEGGWGEQPDRPFKNTYNERVIIGCKNPIEYDEDEAKGDEQLINAYNPALVTKALVVLQEKIDKAENDDSSSTPPTTGFGEAPTQSGGNTGFTVIKDDPFGDFDESDLPF